MNKMIEEVIQNTDEQNQEKTDWTAAWSSKYPVLKRYQKEVDIDFYTKEIRDLREKLMADYGYSLQDAMLVLKDILYHEYLDQKKNNNCPSTLSMIICIQFTYD